MSDRRNAAEYAAAGGALLGASAAADGVVAYDRKRRNMDGPVRAAAKRKFTRRHAGQLGVKIGGRAAFAAGLPLAAYGGYKMVRPDGPVPKLDARRDVVKPVARGVALKDMVDEQEKRFSKTDLTRKETNTLVARKKRGQAISTAAGVMGLAALGLRAPEAAKFAASRSTKLAGNGRLARLAAKEPNATKASNALGIASIGTGAAGSLNYAAQQKLETKAIKKSLGDAYIKNVGKVRVLSSPKKDFFDVIDNRDTRRYVHRSRLQFRKKPKAKLVPVNKPSAMQGAPAQLELPFGKADDRFLRAYRDRISPSAEEGYKYLKRGRNVRMADAAVSSGFAGLSGGLGVRALKSGSKGWAAVGAAGAGLSGVSAIRSGRDAARWDSKMVKIKAKAKERAAAGQYARPVAKSDKTYTIRQRQLEGLGMAAGGVGLATAAANTGRLVGAYEEGAGRLIARRMNTATGKQKSQLGAAARKLRQPGRRNTRRIGFAGAGFAAAAPLFWTGGRRVVEKKLDQYDWDAGMAGGLAAAGGYQLANYATNPIQRRQEKNFSPEAKAKAKAWAKENFGTGKRGEPNMPPKGDPKWKNYNRNYPLNTGAQMKLGPVTMDYGKYRRAYSRLQGGKSQIAITAGLGVAGGIAALKANRKYDPVQGREYKYRASRSKR